MGLISLLEEARKAGISSPSHADFNFHFVRYAHTDPCISDRLLNYFKADARFEIFDNKILNVGMGFATITYDNLVAWSLWTCDQDGADAVGERLERYLSLDYSPALRILAISGLEVDKPFELANGISIVPLSMLPPSQIRNMIDPPHLRPEALLKLGGPSLSYLKYSNHAPNAALVKHVKLQPKVVREADINTHPIVRAELEEVCECLTVLNTSCTAITIASWCELEDWTPLYGFVGASWTGPVHDVLNSSCYKFSQEDAVQFDLIVTSFRALDKDTRDKLKIPMQRLNQARRRTDPADKAIDMGIAFESLYFSGKEQKEQLSFTFGLRAAWFLGDASNRALLQDKFRAIYTARSIAVHTGKLPASIKVPNVGAILTTEFLKEADELCVISIKRIIEQGGFPIWDNTILGLN